MHIRLYDDAICKKGLVSIPPHYKASSDPMQNALKLLLDPVARNNAQGRTPHGFICLHVDDLFMGGDNWCLKRRYRYLHVFEKTSQ